MKELGLKWINKIEKLTISVMDDEPLVMIHVNLVINLTKLLGIFAI